MEPALEKRITPWRLHVAPSLQEASERGRHPGPELAERGGLLAEDRSHRLGRRLPRERAAAREHLVEHGPEREDVRASIGRLAAHLLGRHVSHGAENGALTGQAQLLGLEVAVHDPFSRATARPRAICSARSATFAAGSWSCRSASRLATQPRVPSPVDLAHSAGAQG
jgi:hypothetical protein